MIPKKLQNSQEGTEAELIEGDQLEIEASWAPADPRDRLYDETATPREKFLSIFRIIASFHPVLNFFLLITDSMRRAGFIRTVLILGAVLAGLYVLLIWQKGSI